MRTLCPTGGHFALSFTNHQRLTSGIPIASLPRIVASRADRKRRTLMIQQQQNPNKKSYKVLSPLAKKDGSTYWMRLGTAYTNKDDSINLYLDAMPPTKDNRYHLQIRELDAEEL